MSDPSYRPRRRGDDEKPAKPPATERVRRMLAPPEKPAGAHRAGGQRAETAEPSGRPGPPVAPPAPDPASAAPAAPPAGPSVAWEPASGWSIMEMAAVLAVTVLVTVVEAWLLGSDAVTNLPPPTQMVTRGVVVLVYYVILLAFVWWLTARRHRSFSQAVGLRPFEVGRSLLLVVGALVGIRVVEFVYAYLVPAPPADLTRLFGATSTGVLVSVILWGLVAPFVEEVVFRGVVLGALTDLMPVWAAVGLSAVLFAGVHFSLYLFVPFTVAGVALALVARRTDSLWPAVILHSLYNLSSVALAYWLHR